MREIKVADNFVAYTQGQMARNNGEDWRTNPYPLSGDLETVSNRQDWHLGFQNGQQRSKTNTQGMHDE